MLFQRTSLRTILHFKWECINPGYERLRLAKRDKMRKTALERAKTEFESVWEIEIVYVFYVIMQM